MRRSLTMLAAGVLLTGCGGGDSSKPAAAAPEGQPDDAAAKVAQQYVDAYVAKDAEEICGVLAAQVRTQLSAKGSCVSAIRMAMPKTSQRLKVDQAFRDGAAAIVTFRDSPRQVRLVLEDRRWRVIDGGT